MEIIPGIHKIDSIKGANVYLVILKDNSFVVDTGLPGNVSEIANYVSKLGMEPSDIKLIIITHAHLDHIGSVADLRKLTGAKIVIHADDAAILSGIKDASEALGGYGSFIARLGTKIMHYEPVESDIIVQNGWEFGDYMIIHTPGHTNGSISVYNPGRVIFTGDILMTNSKGNVKPRRTLIIDEIKMINSYQAVARLDFDTLLPGHNAPVVGNASRKVKSMLATFKT